MKFQKNLKFFEKVLKKVLTFSFRWYIIHIVRWGTQEQQKTSRTINGVWLSLARALDLGSRGRRFESCHPDLFFEKYFIVHAGVVQW